MNSAITLRLLRQDALSIRDELARTKASPVLLSVTELCVGARVTGVSQVRYGRAAVLSDAESG